MLYGKKKKKRLAENLQVYCLSLNSGHSSHNLPAVDYQRFKNENFQYLMPKLNQIKVPKFQYLPPQIQPRKKLIKELYSHLRFI